MRRSRAGCLAAAAIAVAATLAMSSTTTAGAARPVTAYAAGAPRGVKGAHSTATRHSPEAMYLHMDTTIGSIAPRPKVYLVFWGKQWSVDPAQARNALTAFFTNLYGPADKWGMLLDQYCEGLPANTVLCGSKGQHVVHPTSTPLAATWLDTVSAPTNASAQQIANEAAKAATHFGNDTQATNANAIYVLASPHGVRADGMPAPDACAFHSVMPTSAGQVPYVMLSYVPDLGAGACTSLRPAKLLDGYFSTVTHEYAESVTDLWADRGWWSDDGNEIADACETHDGRETLGGVSYDVQAVWSNLTMSCRTS